MIAAFPIKKDVLQLDYDEDEDIISDLLISENGEDNRVIGTQLWGANN